MCYLLTETQENSQSTPYSGVFLREKNAHRETPADFELSRKELDEETGFYYYGARYLNPKTSVWISADPAVGDYIPQAPVNDDAKRRNGNLPGMGWVYNDVNFHVYHYSANSPVKYIDPEGRNPLPSHVTNQSAYQNMVTRQAEMNMLVEGFGLATEHLEANNTLLLNFSDQHTLGPYRVKLPLISEAKAAEYLNSPSKTSAPPCLETQMKE
jgi:RHS repeat-associated protein